MPRNPAYRATFTVVDSSSENSAYAVNIAAETYADTADLSTNTVLAALRTATEALIDGELKSVAVTSTSRISSAAFAANGNREDKMLVMYEDNVTRYPYVAELPCRKNTLPRIAGSDEYDITVAEFAAFVTAFEAAAVSSDGNAVTVKSIRLVGRNT